MINNFITRWLFSIIYRKWLYSSSQKFLEYYALILAYQQFEGPKMVLYHDELFDNSLKYLTRFFDLITHSKNTTPYMDELSKNYSSHLQSSLVMYNNKTGEKGAALGDIPLIYFNNPLLRPFHDTQN